MAKKTPAVKKTAPKKKKDVLTFEYAGNTYTADLKDKTLPSIAEAMISFDIGFVKGKGTFTLGKKSTTVAGMRLRKVLNNKIVATLVAKAII